MGVNLAATVPGFRGLSPPAASLNCRVHSNGSSFLQDTALHSLAPALLPGSIPGVLIMAQKFKAPLWTLSTSSDMAPGSLGVLHSNTF